MKKRVLSLGIVLTMMASSMQTFAEDYSDMPTGWSNAAMTYAVNNGYIKGSNGKLNPQGLATRAQVASIFARVLKLENKADLSSYTDVNASQWYYDDLAKAVDAGLFKGSDNKLRPNDNITREEVMAIIARAYDLTGENANLSAFTDGSDVSSWAVNAVSALVENDIVNGSNGKLNPKNNITREEFAQLLYNCQNKFGADEESTEITTDAEDTTVDTTEESSTETTTFVGKNSLKAAGGGSSSSSSSKKSNTKTTEATTETTTEATTETTTAVALESQNKVTVDGADYYVATLEKPMSDYTFTFNGTAVTPTAVNAEKTIVKYSDNALSGYKFAKKTLTYGEYWYAETSDGFNGTLSTEFAKNGAVAEIPDSYTATQSADDKYAATGADTDAGMYDAVSRATTGYGLGRLSFTQAVNALNSNGEMAPFSSSIKYENGDYTVVRPDNAKTDFGYDGSSNRGSNGKITATGIKDVVVAVSKDMAVNAEILKNISGYEAQAQKVSDEIASLNFDADLNENNVYAYKELNANGLYGKRVVNDNVSVKNVGNYSEANTNDDNKFTVNTKYAKRFGDVTFLVYFDDYANMKADDPAHKNINTDEAVAGKVGEFKDYIYNVQGAKIEYLGEDGTATPVVAGAKFASDLWISPNHGPVVEVAVTNSYDRFKAFGNGKYRITLVADGYKDVVLESSARFDIDSPLKMQGDDDDVNEITNGTDLVLNYDINNAVYAESLVNAVANGTANITIGEGRNTVAENGKVVVNGNVLTLTFENVKDSLKKDTQYTVTFPTLDYNDADKLGMTASVHYAPADETTTIALETKDKVTVDGADYYVATLEKPMSDYTFTFNGTAVTPTAVNAEKTIVKYSDNALSGYKFAKKTLTYGEYWYAETSDGFNGTLSTEFAKNGAVAEIPDSYTATQSADDKYAANGADTDAGMYDAVSRATTGYGLGRLSFKQAVNALNSNGEMAPFSSSIKYENGAYTIVRPDNAKADFGYDGSSNRGSNGKITATGIKDVVVAVSKDMAVNAEILKNVSGYEAQAQKVSDEIASLNFDADLNESNVYAYKELNANGLYGKRVVNDNVSVKNVGNYSEANTNDNNKFTVNTKYAKRFGDVTFLVYFDDYANMKADDPAHKNINTDEAVAGKVGEFKDYIYNVQGAKIEYLGEDGTATPVVAGAKFASDLWISPNHGPVVEVAVTNSYDRFKAFGNGKYRITLVADGYKDVVLESSARFDIDSPLKMQGDDDDVNEITNGTDLVLNYDINNAVYAESLVNAVANGTANITIGEGRNTVAENGKVVVNGNVLTLTFENVKDSLKKDTQYTVTFPTLDYNDADKLGMTASVHYAPADAVSTTAEENNEEKAVVTETENNTTVFEDVVKDNAADITDVIAVALPEVDETKAVVVDETTVAGTEETTEEVTEETTEEATAETIVEEVTESETVAE